MPSLPSPHLQAHVEALPILTAAVSYYDVAYGLDQAPVPPAAVYYLAIPVFEAIITEVPVFFFVIHVVYRYTFCLFTGRRLLLSHPRIGSRHYRCARLFIRNTFCFCSGEVHAKSRSAARPRYPSSCISLYILFKIIHFVFALAKCMPNPAGPPRCLPVSFLFVSRYTFCFKSYILFFH
jgi:hypothetical protein